MPEPTTLQWLIDTARDLVEPDRDAFLDRECDGDDALRRSVEAALTVQALPDTLDDSHTTAALDARGQPGAEPGFEPARLIGRFAVLSKLGEGGMGAVYAAYDDDLGRKVAIKLLHPRRDADRSRTRFVREAQAMAQLSHPNVASIYEVGEVNDQVYIAMEFIDGTTLGEWCQQSGKTPREILAMYLQAGRGLAAAHDAALIHRDFKPANVLVGSDGRARVLDFGLARSTGDPSDSLIEAAGASDSQPPRVLSSTLTVAGALMGTPVYMSPEQLRGEAVDARSDQYNFCVALYEAMFQIAPFECKTLKQNRLAKQAGDIRAPTAVDAEFELVHQALVRGLSPDPARRWGSMTELIDQLDQVLDAHTTPDLRLSRRQIIAFFGGFGLSILVMGVGLAAVIGDVNDMRAEHTLAIGVGMLTVLLVITVLIRRWLRGSAMLRKLILSIIAILGVVLGHRVLATTAGTPVPQILTVDLMLFCAATVVGAITLTPTLWLIAPVFFTLAAVATHYPESAAWCMGFASAALVLLGVVVWRLRPNIPR